MNLAGRQRLFAATGLVLSLATWVALVSSRPLPQWQPVPTATRSWRGAFHVHSADSHDCTTSQRHIAAAAKANGLDFIILTDHNAQQAAAREVEGVMLLSFAELTTPAGHVIALAQHDLPDRSARHRQDLLPWLQARGAAAIVAHPSDRKRPWTAQAAAADPYEGAAGLEVVNQAAAARRRGGPLMLGLLPLLLQSVVHPSLAVAQLYDHDVAALALWDSRPDPQFVGLCGLDAHGFLPTHLALRSWQVVISQVPDHSASLGEISILAALRTGRFFCNAALLGTPGVFDFSATNGRNTVARSGDTAPVAGVEALRVELSGLTDSNANIVLLRGSEVVMRSSQHRLTLMHPPAGSYRVEIHATLPDGMFGLRRVPVLYSNRIRVAGA